MTDKIFSDSSAKAQLGVNLIERTILHMGHIWRPIDLHDVGVDGEIELTDSRTRAVLHRLVRAQVKTRSNFSNETNETFEFVCEEKDVAYWLRSPVPVLLICVRAGTDDAFCVCVTEWFADEGRRASRRVRFDKTRDRFDEAVGARLTQLAGGPASAAAPAPSFVPEELVSNLLPIVQVPDRIWAAPTACRTRDAANARYAEAGGERASDYLLRGEHLHSFRDPHSCALAHLVDGPAESFAASRWAQADDPNLAHRYAELLRRALLQQVKGDLSWQPERKIFYFTAPRDPLGRRFIVGARKQPRQVVWVEHFTNDKGEELVSYVRHHAFAPRFLRVDGAWQLSVEPTYYYSWDGERESARADVLAAGIKKLERNGAVLGSLMMWQRWLTRPPTLFGGEPPLLVFGPAETVKVDRSLDEKLWNGAVPEPAADAITGQQEFAA